MDLEFLLMVGQIGNVDVVHISLLKTFELLNELLMIRSQSILRSTKHIKKYRGT